MFNTVKSFSKSVKRIFASPQSRARRSLAIVKPAVKPAETVDSLLASVAEKLRAFAKAVKAYPVNSDADWWYDVEGAALIDAAEMAGFPEVEEFGAKQTAAFCAALEYDGTLDDIEFGDDSCAIDCVYKIVTAIKIISRHDYTFLPYVNDDDEFADWLIEEKINCRLTYAEYCDLIDWVGVARVTRNEEGGRYTSRGYFQHGELEF